MSKVEVALIDYGCGNLLSVKRALEVCGATVEVTNDPNIILTAKKIVLPGVGAFPDAMNSINSLGLIPVFQELGRRKTPLLGICLGMQILLGSSEEFLVTSGLGLIPGHVVPIPSLTMGGVNHKVPHISWSGIHPADPSIGWATTILQDNKPGDMFYFVHSFMASLPNSVNKVADCIYGGHLIPAVIASEHIIGCQFHPEKSGPLGLQFLRKFITQ